MLAKQLGLTSLLQKPPHFLSGGQKKLVSIADVLIMEPEIIIFDEPMAALDPVNTDRIREILEQLTAEGKTIVLSTHDVDFAFEWADRIAVFSDGNLIQTGTPKEVFANGAVLEQGNLKMPAVLQIFQSLCAQGYFEQGMVCPSTAAALVQMISEKKTTER